jgi:hypothetical protein
LWKNIGKVLFLETRKQNSITVKHNIYIYIYIYISK